MPRQNQEVEEEQTNGQAQYDFDPVEHYDPSEIKPDAPVGGWDFVIPHNQTVCKATKPKENSPKRYPMVMVQVQLKRAHEEENESAEGTTLPFFITAWGEEKARAGNASKRELQEFCKQIGLEGTGQFPHGDALAAGSFAVFDPFIEEIEGREGKCWTYHQTNDETGEVQTRITFRKPKQAASNRAAAPAPKASAKNGAASKASASKKPSSSGRR